VDSAALSAPFPACRAAAIAKASGLPPPFSHFPNPRMKTLVRGLFSRFRRPKTAIHGGLALHNARFPAETGLSRPLNHLSAVRLA
jgi:hypothetical protein